MINRDIYFVFLLYLFLNIGCSNDHEKRLRKRELEKIDQKSSKKLENNNTNHFKTVAENFINLKIISWNIQDFGSSLDDNQIKEIADVIKNFDIVCIQEIVGKDFKAAQRLAYLVNELNFKGAKWDYVLSDPTQSNSMHKSERYAFIWKTDKIKKQGRGMLLSELKNKVCREPFMQEFKIDDFPFIIFNFHSVRYDESPEIEINHLVNFLIELRTKNIIWTGDFNLEEKHNVFKNLYSYGFNSALKNTKTTLKLNCVNGNYLSHSIDNIFYSDSFQLNESKAIDIVGNCQNLKKQRKLSDHLPIFAEFNILKENNKSQYSQVMN